MKSQPRLYGIKRIGSDVEVKDLYEPEHNDSGISVTKEKMVALKCTCNRHLGRYEHHGSIRQTATLYVMRQGATNPDFLQLA